MLSHSQLEYRKQIRNDFLVDHTVQTSAYSSGQVIGSAIKIDHSAGVNGPNIEAPLSSILQSISVIDPDSQSKAIDLFFFSELPASSFVDGATFAPSVADLVKCIGVVSVAAADYASGGANGTVAAGKNQSNIGRVLKPSAAAGTDIYCVLVARDTPTYAGGTIYLHFQFSQGL